MRLAGGERGLRPLGDQPPLLLGERGIEVQHEGIGIGAKLGDDERHALRHQPGDEGDIAGEPVELGDDDGALADSGRGQRGGELRAPIERIAALAGLDLGELAEEGESFAFGEAGDHGSLGLDSEPGAALPGGGDAIVGDCRFHVAPQ